MVFSRKLGLATWLLVLPGCCCCPIPMLPTPSNNIQQIKADTDTKQTLAQARAAHQSNHTFDYADVDPLGAPPPTKFKIVSYDSPAGRLSGYLTPDPGDGQRHPAIIWITGGYCNSVGSPWQKGGRDNDQSASAYREAGIVMMFPALRGGSGNPGNFEGFYGEVDDVLAARDFLAAQPYVDPNRIYLGGHSTGGTLALLAAEMGGDFRGVFSFGPVEDVSHYQPDYMPDVRFSEKEIRLRSPAYWLHSIESPTFVIEGSRGNATSLNRLRKLSDNPLVQFHTVPGADHFNVLAPVNELIAEKILSDTGNKSNINLSSDELQRAMDK